MDITFPDLHELPFKARINLFCSVDEAGHEEVEHLAVYPTLEITFGYFPGSIDITDLYVLGEAPNGFLTRHIHMGLRANGGIEWLEGKILPVFEAELARHGEQAKAENYPPSNTHMTGHFPGVRFDYRTPQFLAE